MSVQPEPGPGVRVIGERPSIDAPELPSRPYEFVMETAGCRPWLLTAHPGVAVRDHDQDPDHEGKGARSADSLVSDRLRHQGHHR
jgi:hypothetical protein